MGITDNTKSETLSDSLGKYINTIEEMALQSAQILAQMRDLHARIDRQLGILKVLKDVSKGTNSSVHPKE